jgi:DnaJ homolog subfamily C member 28
MEKHAKARRNIEINPDEEVKVFDIKHTAPQHRQYLTHGGFGSGTPFQREKQHQQRRAMKAQENVLEHRLQKSLATDNALVKKGGDHFKKHAIKTKYGFDRVVEDLIQEAMSKGDFNNLSGAGKPLKDLQSQNPYVDFTTHKLNKILFDNGFVPEWITLQKEIRESIESIHELLRVKRAKFHFPLLKHEELSWQRIVKDLEVTIKGINKKIDNFNLLVPVLDKQMVHVQLDRIAEKIKNEEPTDRPVAAPRLESNAPSDYKTEGLFSFIDKILK